MFPSLRRAALVFLAACSAAKDGTNPLPHAEFLLGAADSTFWVATTSGQTRVRGAPLILARYDGRFYEVYAHHEDLSYPAAILLGDRIFRRDILTGDSTPVFADTVVRRMAQAYAAAHPNERPLGPNEDGDADPETNITAEFDILDIFGPYLSYEYHLDVEVPDKQAWHATRHGVIDLRSGKECSVGDLFGSDAGDRLVGDASRAFAAMRDSVVRQRPFLEGEERRAADIFGALKFDASSFTLAARDGQLAIHFSVPGRGEGAAGNVVELEPVDVTSPAWWKDVAPGLPVTGDAGDDRWRRANYHVVARYDTSGDIAHVSLADTAEREWPVAKTRAPLFQVLWLDDPAVRSDERTALTRAFNHAASYDEGARVALSHRSPNLLFVNRYAPNEDGPRKPARNVRAHDAGACEQHGPCVRRRDSLDDGQMRGDRRVSSQPRERRDGLHRPRRLSRANTLGRPGRHEIQCELCGPKLHGSGRPRRG